MRELAQAQVANTAVLQQIGGRLPSPVPPSPGSHISSSHAVPAGGFGEFAAAGDYRGSPGVFGSLECCARQGTTAHVHRCVVEHQQQQLCSHEGIVNNLVLRCAAACGWQPCLTQVEHFPRFPKSNTSRDIRCSFMPAARSQPARPPSCPLTGGVLNGPFAASPCAAQPRHRAPSPDIVCSHGNSYASVHAQTNTSVLSSTSGYARSHASSSVGPLPAAAAAPGSYLAMPEMQQQQHTGSPGVQQQEQWSPWQQQPEQQRTSQHAQFQPQPQQHWQVEVVLAGHDADIASVKGAVQCLEQDRHAAMAASDGMAAQLNNLAQRVDVLEQTAAAAAVSAVQSTTATVAALPESGSPAAGFGSIGLAGQASTAVAPAVGMLDQADLVSAIEGLAADAVQGAAKLEALEGAYHETAGQHGDSLLELRGTTDQLAAKLQQVRGAAAVYTCSN